jgi:hypothetical protein
MAIFSALDWPVRLLLAAMVTAAVGTGVFFLVRTSGDGSQPSGVVGTTTAEASPTSDQLSPTPQPPATEEPTQPPATEAPPTVEPTPDTRVAIRDLPTPDQIQLGKDGKYFVADRGDGCRWDEYSRMSDPETGTSVFLGTDCPADFRISFRPATGEVFMVL